MPKIKKSRKTSPKQISKNKQSKSGIKSRPLKIKKSRIAGFMWECICGNISYGEKSPFECNKCGKMDNFTQVPEEIREERERDLLGAENEI